MYILTGEMYISIWRPPDISGGRQLENEMYISSKKISTGEMYISIWRPPDISGGRHLQNEMYILSEKMYISTGEMYYSYLAAARYI